MSKKMPVLSGLLLFCVLTLAAAEGGEQPEPGVAEQAETFTRPLRSQGAASSSALSANASVPESALNTALVNTQNLDRALTRYYINQFRSPAGLEWLKAAMVRGGPYLTFIRQQIEARGLPPELLFLPVIESSFNAGAVSRSGAVGLWQFMRNSVGPFNIKINEWVDERRDFWKATEAALQKLTDNYNYFHDWALALAAYNAGLGAVSGVIRNSGVRDYWVLSERKLLKTETIHYVPKFIAAVYVLSNAREFGLVLWPEDQRWTRIAVDRPVDLNLLAREAGLDAAMLKTANRELTYAITPPDKDYLLKIPEAHAEQAAAVLARKDLPLINYYIHTIRSGDTLLALAKHYGITVDQITVMNPGVRERFLRIGATLMIPALNERAPFVAERPGEDLDFSGTHLVKRGESLWSISLAYGIDPETLAEANNMGLNDVLREGRLLKTPIN